jgi:hypothetical protein
MPEETLQDDPSVESMLRWIAATYHMPDASLARMFERSQSTIRSWMTEGRISHENLMKVRASFYHLHNARDPHSLERKCSRCGHWRPAAQFKSAKAVCSTCLAAPGAQGAAPGASHAAPGASHAAPGASHAAPGARSAAARTHAAKTRPSVRKAQSKPRAKQPQARRTAALRDLRKAGS